MVVALAYVAATDLPDRRVRRWLLPVTELAILLGPALFVFQLPLILLAARSIIGPEPVQRTGHAALLGRPLPVRRRWRAGGIAFQPGRAWRRNWGQSHAVGSQAAWAIWLLLKVRTSPWALIEGVVLRPSGQADALTILAPNTSWSIVWLPVTVLGVWLCGRLLARESTPAMLLASAATRLVAAFLLVSAVPQVNTRLGLAIFRYPFVFLPLVAVVLLPTLSAGRTSTVMARRVLAVLALTHSLHAFPVAGAQVYWS